MEVLFPHTLVVGLSGAGKSRSLKNLPIEHTAIINTEHKAMPFISRHKIKYLKDSKDSFSDYFINALDKAIANPDIRYIGIDSFTSYKELLLREAQFLYKDWDVYTYYNGKIQELFLKCKQVTNKIIMWTAIPTTVESPDGVDHYAVKVDGSVWKDAVEKEFTTVLWVDTSMDGDKLKHQFITNKIAGFTNTPAKSPEGLLEPRMENDLNQYVQRLVDAYGNPWEDAKPTSKKKAAKETSAE